MHGRQGVGTAMNKKWLLASSIFILVALTIGTSAFAERLSEYEGTIGSAKVKVTIVSQATTLIGGLPPGPIKGEYFYVSYLKDIPIEGEIGTDRSITIYELGENNKKTAVIKGQFPETDPQHHFASKSKLESEVITGTWSRPDGSATLPVYLCSIADTFTDMDHRYINAGVQDDKALESKVRAFRSAVIAGDKKSVSTMINYPITITLDGKHRDLANAAELLKTYDLIFSTKFIKAIKDAVPHNMFVRYDGVMLGNGEAWFDADGKVKALNN
jgi:hypothetical protein